MGDGYFFGTWFYGKPRRREPAWRRDEKLLKIDDKNESITEVELKPLSDELKTGLHVESDINLHIGENTTAHFTDKYECTEDRKTDDGKDEAAELVLRRGKPFKMTITCNRPFRPKDDDLFIVLRTGKFPELSDATHCRIQVVENKHSKLKSKEWGARLIDCSGNDAVIEVIFPTTCAIGEYELTVETKTVLKNKTTILTHKHPDFIYVLFNPWCKGDQTYMADHELLKEYVCMDQGCVYRGNQYKQKPKAWFYGQFEEEIVEASMFLTRKCFKAKQMYKMADAVQVARAIAQVVNCCDADNGVLWGNWSGDYEGGVAPWKWNGSVKILRQYLSTGQPVKYGQCWVFSAVTTTVCRALGIPARSVTNYASAHDTNKSCTIDKYHEILEDGTLKKLDCGGDSIWNFHVWNDVWMSRPDIPCENNIYDGWQAIDATPQEASEGLMVCGPCSHYAIKHGHVTKPYDTAFVFAEINADEVYWKKSCSGGWTKFKVKANKVGKRMSTKTPDGKPYDPDAWFKSKYREDVTEQYKYGENTEKNKQAVLKAALGTPNPSGAYRDKQGKNEVVFKLTHDDDLFYGQAIEVKLSAKNMSARNRRTVKAVTFYYHRQKYTGEQGKLLMKDAIPLEADLKPGEKHEFTSIIKPAQYMGELDDTNSMIIQALAVVKKCGSSPEEHCIKEHVVELDEPSLSVKVPKTVAKGDKFNCEISFTNPLEEPLTDCAVEYESSGVPSCDSQQQPNVNPNETYNDTLQLKAKRKGEHSITVTFTSKQLKDVGGCASFTVE